MVSRKRIAAAVVGDQCTWPVNKADYVAAGMCVPADADFRQDSVDLDNRNVPKEAVNQ